MENIVDKANTHIKSLINQIVLLQRLSDGKECCYGSLVFRPDHCDGNCGECKNEYYNEMSDDLFKQYAVSLPEQNEKINRRFYLYPSDAAKGTTSFVVDEATGKCFEFSICCCSGSFPPKGEECKLVYETDKRESDPVSFHFESTATNK
jgi:hypothetical protein